MPPAFACFPVCSTFLALGLLGVVVVLAGWHRSAGQPADPSALAAASATAPQTDAAGPGLAPDRPPFPPWLFVALPAAVVLLTALVGWLGPA